MDERIKNIKIAVHNEEESRQVQEKLFELGVEWFVYAKTIICGLNYLYTRDNNISFSLNKKLFDLLPHKEIYVDDLLAMEKKETEEIKEQITINEQKACKEYHPSEPDINVVGFDGYIYSGVIEFPKNLYDEYEDLLDDIIEDVLYDCYGTRNYEIGKAVEDEELKIYKIDYVIEENILYE